MFRGNAPARIDEKGRLKIPNAFRALVESEYGRDLFLTSLRGDCVQVYPMPVWLEVEQKVAAMPSTHPSRVRFLGRVNYFGGPAEIDAQGRVMIPYRLREAATMSGDVDVLGAVKHLEVWNHDRFVAKLQLEPYTDDDARALAGFGV